MANMYQTGLQALATGGIVWGTTSMKVMLVTSSYTYDADHDDRADVTGEITNGGYSAGGNALAGESSALDDANNEAEFDATDTVFSSLAAGDQPYAAIVYKSTGVAANDILLAYCTLTTPPAPNGANYTVQWGSEGVFKLAA